MACGSLAGSQSFRPSSTAVAACTISMRMCVCVCQLLLVVCELSADHNKLRHNQGRMARGGGRYVEIHCINAIVMDYRTFSALIFWIRMALQECVAGTHQWASRNVPGPP